MQRDMTRASELLDMSADSLVTATQRVYVDNMNCHSRRHLIRAAKDLLEGTLKVRICSIGPPHHKSANLFLLKVGESGHFSD